MAQCTPLHPSGPSSYDLSERFIQDCRDAAARMKRSSSDHSLTARALRSSLYETHHIQSSPDTPFHFSYVQKGTHAPAPTKPAAFCGSNHHHNSSASTSQNSSDSDQDAVHYTFAHDFAEGNDMCPAAASHPSSWKSRQLALTPTNSADTEEDASPKTDPIPVPVSLPPRRLSISYSHHDLPSHGHSQQHHHLSFSPYSKSDIFGSSACSSPRTESTSSFGLESDEHHEDADLIGLRGANHLTRGHAAYELFLRLNHARQTLDFAKRQAAAYAELDKAEMGIWQALGTLNELREYEAPLINPESSAGGLSLRDHAFQTAELCRLHYPQHDWLHLVGLIHSLGKLLAHPRFGAQPQWAVCGETFPLGCRFAHQISSSHFFSVNPDRRRRLYNTPCGIYTAGCGLQNVVMSWGAPDYMYLVLLLNQTSLPPEALFVLRYHKFASLTRNAYHHLLSPEDRANLPLLAHFQQLSKYQAMPLPEGALEGEELYSYYNGLIEKYLGEDKLFW